MSDTSGRQSLLTQYVNAHANQPLNSATAAWYASLDHIAATSPDVADAIVSEFRDQRRNLKLIASENYSSLATQLAHGNVLTDKYAEGYPQHRFYAGCGNVDTIEAEAAQLACSLFNADHAYVQPHSGADANLVAFLSILAARVRTPAVEKLGETNPVAVTREQWNDIRNQMNNQRLLALDFYSGGHLTHGYRLNVSSQLFDVHSYSVDAKTKLIDMDALHKQVREVHPLILLAGYSAYPRKIDFAAMREMADEVNAVFMVDMAHFAGLVAGKVFTGNFDPVVHAHVVTTTTHKTLRGPRGGMVLCTAEFADWVDKGCPTILGGPLPHVLAAKAVALREASTPDFARYAKKIVDNSQALATACIGAGMEVLTGGTDNHLMLIDVNKSFGLTGRQAESALRECGITLNRNALPFDGEGPWYTSGLRLGTPAVTTLGMGADEMKEIASVIALVLSNTSRAVENGETSRAKYVTEATARSQARSRIQDLLSRHPLYPELDLDAMLRWSANSSGATIGATEVLTAS